MSENIAVGEKESSRKDGSVVLYSTLIVPLSALRSVWDELFTSWATRLHSALSA